MIHDHLAIGERKFFFFFGCLRIFNWHIYRRRMKFTCTVYKIWKNGKGVLNSNNWGKKLRIEICEMIEGCSASRVCSGRPNLWDAMQT